MYVHIYIYNDHCCGVETNHDVTCRDNGTRLRPKERSLLSGKATRLHDADDYYRFR